MNKIKFEDLSPENQVMFEELTNPKVRIPKKYLDYLFRAICHFDMYEDELTDLENDAFHYMYSLCSEHKCNERQALKYKMLEDEET